MNRICKNCGKTYAMHHIKTNKCTMHSNTVFEYFEEQKEIDEIREQKIFIAFFKNGSELILNQYQVDKIRDTMIEDKFKFLIFAKKNEGIVFDITNTNVDLIINIQEIIYIK